MITLRLASDRGHFDHGWLKTHHTFSFGEYRDEAHMSFRSLRVINEDFVDPGKGFATHFHRDMEILTFMLAGELAHKDSMGNGSSIGVGEIQYMSAGKGVEHSEFNPSSDRASHLLQIWIMPQVRGVAPRYSQIRFDRAESRGAWLPLASPDGREGSVAIRQDAHLWLGGLTASPLLFSPTSGRGQWVQALSGEIQVGGHRLLPGDGAAIEGESSLTFTGPAGSECLLFDLG